MRFGRYRSRLAGALKLREASRLIVHREIRATERESCATVGRVHLDDRLERGDGFIQRDAIAREHRLGEPELAELEIRGR